MSDAPFRARSDASTTPMAVFVAAVELPAVGDLLQRLRRSTATLQAGGPIEAMAWCATHGSPEIMLVDISGLAQPLAALLELAAQAGPACRIVALGDRQDVDFYRQLLQGGIFDYLLKPPRMDLLADTLQRADDDRPLGLGGAARSGRTVACIGCAGGLGTSTLVAALGQALAHRWQTPTVLVDFDRRKGDLPLLLGLEADAGLAALLDATSIDPRLLQRTLLGTGHDPASTTGQRLQLLAQRPSVESAIDPERVLELGGALSQLFSLSLWDLPSHRPSGADEVLTHAEIRIVLTECSLQGARNTQRLLSEIGDESAGQRLLVVTSGARQSGHPVLEHAQLEDFIGRAIDCHLPQAGPVLAGSLLDGPLVAATAPAYALAVEQLGLRLLGRTVSATPVSGLVGRLSRLFALTRRPAATHA